MSAYIIVIREEPLHNEAEYAAYQQAVAESPAQVPLKPLAINGAIQALEGAAPDAVVLLEFASVEEAKAWYGSPGYQAALPHRLAAGKYRSFIFEGI